MSIEARVREIVGAVLQIPPEGINVDAPYLELGADSLNVVEIAMAIEEEFNLEIPDEEIEKIMTVKALVDYIERDRQEAAR